MWDEVKPEPTSNPSQFFFSKNSLIHLELIYIYLKPSPVRDEMRWIPRKNHPIVIPKSIIFFFIA